MTTLLIFGNPNFSSRVNMRNVYVLDTVRLLTTCFVNCVSNNEIEVQIRDQNHIIIYLVDLNVCPKPWPSGLWSSTSLDEPCCMRTVPYISYLSSSSSGSVFILNNATGAHLSYLI